MVNPLVSVRYLLLDGCFGPALFEEDPRKTLARPLQNPSEVSLPETVQKASDAGSVNKGSQPSLLFDLVLLRHKPYCPTFGH